MANKIEISGRIVQKPKFSHKVYGESFYEFSISSERHSGTCDVVPCLVSETLVNEINENEQIMLFGEIRSCTKKIDGKSKLLVHIFVEATGEYKGRDKNIVKLQGFICKQPVFRTTPLGKDIADVFIVSKRQRIRKTDYLPCIAWGRNALRASNMSSRTVVNVFGRFQSRSFEKKCENGKTQAMVAYEISLNSISPIIIKEMRGITNDSI